MGRTGVLQDIRKMRFEEIYGRYRQKRLSSAEASDLLGGTERTFLRWRGRYEEEGLGAERWASGPGQSAAGAGGGSRSH